MDRVIYTALLLFFFFPSLLFAKGEIERHYIGLSLNQASIQIDEFASSSYNDSDTAPGFYAAGLLSDNLYLEYGIQQLGKYQARYEITAGNIQFLEEHVLDFNKNLYFALRAHLDFETLLSHRAGNPYPDAEHPDLRNTFLNFVAGINIWQVRINVDGQLYDSGVLQAPYGVDGDDYGISWFYGIGIATRVSDKAILSFSREIYRDVGRGVELVHQDGKTEEYTGRHVELVSIRLSYWF